MKHKIYITIISILLFVSCAKSKQNVPRVELNKVQISGKIISQTGKIKFPAIVYLVAPLPVSGEISNYEIKTDSLGNFTFDVELETFPSSCGLNTDINPYSSIYFTINRQKSKIEIYYDSIDNIKDVVGVTYVKDAIDAPNIINKMIEYSSNRPRPKLYEKNPEYLPLFADTIINERLRLFVDSSVLSSTMRRIVSKDFKLLMYDVHVFNYKQEMLFNYERIHQKTPDSTVQFFTATKQYYSFLKKMDLNNPEYLYCFSYPEFIQTILNNEILAIPPIGDTPIKEWLKNIKRDFADLTGLKDGLFYDMLAANAYSKQFLYQAKPLSEKQKKISSNISKINHLQIFC